MSTGFAVEIYPQGGVKLSHTKDGESLLFRNESEVVDAFRGAGVIFDLNHVLVASYRKGESGNVLVKTFAITITDASLSKLGFGQAGKLVHAEA